MAEEAQKAIAAALVAELGSFEITLKSISHPNTHRGHTSTSVEQPPGEPGKAESGPDHG